MTWKYEQLEEAIDEAIGAGDPEDPKARKRLHILRAAAELFVRQGYRKTSVDEIAEQAGVAKGTVYLYFKTKVDLLVAAIALEKKEYLGQMKSLFTESMSGRERLRRWIARSMVMAAHMPLASRLMTGDRELATALRDLPADVLARNVERGHDFFGSLLADAVSPGELSSAELRDRAQVLMGLGYFSSSVLAPHVRGHLEPDAFARVLANLIVDGVPRSASEDS